MTNASQNYLAVIKVVGASGGGVNAVNRMIGAGLRDVEFTVINTDAQASLINDADVKLDVSRELTRDLGVGVDPSKGRQAAEGCSEDIEEALEGANMVFVTAGEGSDAGTGAAPVVARIVRSLGALTVGVVVRPFFFEGHRHATQTNPDIEASREEVDTLIVIPNDKLLQTTDHQMAILDAFEQVDQVLVQGVSGITDLITTPGLVNLDFADVKSIMSQAGSALMGIGPAQGEDRARAAAEMAISSPLLGVSIDGAHGVLLSIASGSDLGLFEASAAAQPIEGAVRDEASIVFGTVIDGALGDEVRITMIAADFDDGHPPRPPRLETARSNQQQPPQPRGGFGGVPGGGSNPFVEGMPLTGGGGSRLTPPHVTPMPPTRPEPRSLRADDDDDLDVSSLMK